MDDLSDMPREADVEPVRWDEPDPADVISLRADEDWQMLHEYYVEPDQLPLLGSGRTDADDAYLRCLEVARESAARTVVIETRYIDADYRSEYSAYYSKAFADIDDSTHRLHFFTSEIEEEQIWNLPDKPGYLGYVIVRPSPSGMVGRSILRPPPELRAWVRTAIREPVSFFGQRLTVEGVPFMSQDTQLGRCAHAATWMCHYAVPAR